MHQTLTDALILPFFWLLTFVLVSSLGFSFLPFRSHKGVLSGNWFTAFWYGLALLIVFLQLWNLFYPVNVYAWLCLFPFAAFGFTRLYKAGFHLATFPKPIVLTLSILIFIFLLLSSLDNTFIYDTHVYHFTYIAWLNKYPVVPGIGNLFIYLGNNQSYFLYPAFLNGLWSYNKGACAANGLLVVAICIETVLLNAKVLLGKDKFSFHSAYQLLFLPLCINAGVTNLSSPTPDIFVNVFTFKIISDLIACIEAKEITFQDIFLLSFYCLFGVVMKFSFIGVALGVMTIVCYLLIKNKLWSLKLIVSTVPFYIVLFVPLIIRGIVASGYLLFPFPQLSVPVDWKVPKQNVIDFNEYVIGFARTHLHGPAANAAAHNYAWVPAWCKRMVNTVQIIMPSISLISIAIYMRLKRISMQKLNLVLIPISVALVFWLVTAPDIRFSVFILWTLGLAPAAYFIINMQARWQRLVPAFVFICSVAIMAKNWNTQLAPLGDITQESTSVFVTKSGLKVNIVKDTPGNDIFTLSGCPIPCTFHYPDSSLMLRRDNIKDGFKIVVKN